LSSDAAFIGAAAVDAVFVFILREEDVVLEVDLEEDEDDLDDVVRDEVFLSDALLLVVFFAVEELVVFATGLAAGFFSADFSGSFLLMAESMTFSGTFSGTLAEDLSAAGALPLLSAASMACSGVVTATDEAPARAGCAENRAVTIYKAPARYNIPAQAKIRVIVIILGYKEAVTLLYFLDNIYSYQHSNRF
jgi:hypothetical protein